MHSSEEFYGLSVNTISSSYIDQTAAIFIFLKEDARVGFINRAGSEVLGYPKEQIIGRDWFDTFLPEGVRAASRRHFKDFFLKKIEVPIMHENMLLTKEGDIRHIKWSTLYVKEERGVLGTGLDITDKKSLQIYLAQQDAEKRKQLLSASIEAQEQERHHISRELHDNVGQLLTTCKLVLDVEINNNCSPLLHKAFDSLQQAINAIRTLSHQLNPAQLKELGLESSIRELVETIQLSGKYTVNLQIAGEQYLRSIDAATGLSAFRIIQEGLNNIIKHAAASEIAIAVIGSEQSLDFEIRDNGKGFDTKSLVKGLGLRNIYNRAELFGGSVYIKSERGEGTLLSVCIPVVH